MKIEIKPGEEKVQTVRDMGVMTWFYIKNPLSSLYLSCEWRLAVRIPGGSNSNNDVIWFPEISSYQDVPPGHAYWSYPAKPVNEGTVITFTVE